jgi:hypothetical protein
MHMYDELQRCWLGLKRCRSAVRRQGVNNMMQSLPPTCKTTLNGWQERKRQTPFTDTVFSIHARGVTPTVVTVHALASAGTS